jgi:hypothetical protein
MRFFLSPLVFALGILCMKYTVQITNNTGKIDLAEKYFGTGIGAGTYTFWRLFGLGLCIISVLWIFNKLPTGPKSPPAETTSISYKLLV